jgi:hypothetical protein
VHTGARANGSTRASRTTWWITDRSSKVNLPHANDFKVEMRLRNTPESGGGETLEVHHVHSFRRLSPGTNFVPGLGAFSLTKASETMNVVFVFGARARFGPSTPGASLQYISLGNGFNVERWDSMKIATRML